jgi:hypothetical protein
VIAVARVTVAVREDSPLRPEAFRSTATGDPVGWLEVGDTEVGMYGSPAALRRFSASVLAAAEHAEELGRWAGTLEAA